MTLSLKKTALAFAALPLALSLAACGDQATEGGVAKGEAIEEIAPPAGQQWADMVSKTEDGGYLMGNPEAPIKLVEYGALSCSHCAEFAAEAACCRGGGRLGRSPRLGCRLLFARPRTLPPVIPPTVLGVAGRRGGRYETAVARACSSKKSMTACEKTSLRSPATMWPAPPMST